MPNNGDPRPSRPGEHASGAFTRRGLLRGAAAAGSLPLLAGVGSAVAAGTASAAPPTAGADSAPTIAARPRQGRLREYWLQAESFFHNLVPNGRDEMMGTTFTPDQSSYWALGYRAYTPGWGTSLDPSDDIGRNDGIP